jgi:hypothetical protein
MAGLKLKQQVREGKLTPQAALDLLRATDAIHTEATSSAKWLKRQGAK